MCHCLVWFDPQLDGGPILQHISVDVQSYFHAKVGDFLHPYRTCSMVFDLFEQVQSIVTKVDREDCVSWLPSLFGVFSVTSVWDFLCHKHPIMPQSSLVWFGGNNPRHYFSGWLAIRNCIQTHDRISKWGLDIPLMPVLCALGS